MRVAFVAQPFDTVLPPGQNSLGLWTYEVARRFVGSRDVHVIAGSRQVRESREVDGVRYELIPVSPRAFDIFLDPRRPSNPDAPHRPLVVLDDYAEEFIAEAARYVGEHRIGLAPWEWRVC